MHAILTKKTVVKVNKQMVWFTVCTGTAYGTFVEEYLYQLPTYQYQTYSNILLHGKKNKITKRVYCLHKIKIHSKSR